MTVKQKPVTKSISLDKSAQQLSKRLSSDLRTSRPPRNIMTPNRTTICITVQALNETNDDYSVDVYLMTTSEYQRYTELYYSSHSEQSFYSDVSDALSEISPEWRSLDFTGWRSYRDAHQYESANQINFALVLRFPQSVLYFFLLVQRVLILSLDF